MKPSRTRTGPSTSRAMGRSKAAALLAVCGALAAPGVALADDSTAPEAHQPAAVEISAVGSAPASQSGAASFRFDPIGTAKCIGAVGAFVAGNALVISKIRKAGGVVKVAKILLGAGSSEARLKAALAVFGDITGVTGVVESCS